MQNVRARFVESFGGVIYGPGGREVVKVNVDGMITAEAHRVVKAVIAALEAEFTPEADAIEDSREYLV